MKYFTKIASEPKLLEKVVSSRMALEASIYPKQVARAQIYRKVKSIPFAGKYLEKATMNLVRKRHGGMIEKVLGTSNLGTLRRVGASTAKKTLFSTSKLQSMHRADSLNFVARGGKYPSYLNTYYKSQTWRDRAK